MEEIPLHEACLDGNIMQVKRLLETGVKVNIQDGFGESPLHKVIDCRHPDVEVRKRIIKLLFDKGVDINIRTKDKMTPLHCSAESGFLWAVQFLLDNGANISSENFEGARPIHLSACNGHDRALSILIDHGANVDERNFSQVTPLHLSARAGSFKAFSLLLNRGADITCRDDKDRSVLHYAAKGGNVEIVKLLLDRGFDLDDRDGEGNAPLHFSAKENHSGLTKFILDLFKCVDCRNCHLSTPLLLSVSPIIGYRDLCTTKLLLASGANVRCSDKRGWTPLHYACFVRSYNAVKLILRYHPDVDSVDHETFTPLHLVVGKCRGVDIMQLLLDCNANVNHQDYLGKSPLHLALEIRKPKYVSRLLAHGADITLKDFEYNETPFDLVMSSGFEPYSEIRWMILSHAYKLQALGLLSLAHDFEAVLCCDDSEFYSECIDEVSLTKENKIAEGISLFDVLTAPFNKAIALCRACISREAIVNEKLKSYFPIYGSMLQAKLQRVFEKIHLLRQGQLFFSIAFTDRVPNLNEDCIEMILSYLPYRDLKVLAECCG